jgi:PHD/YefM family antitoxin component YafN of YafNO toxin-antitoxin module
MEDLQFGACAMTGMTVTKAKKQFDDIIDRVARNGERFVIRRGRKTVAAVVSPEDVRALEELEDRLDAELVRRRLADPRQKPIPYEKVRKELRLP